MTARPVDPESRRPVSAAVALVLLLAMAMVAGCVSYPRNGLCGGEFEVYGLADFQKPGDNVVHLTEQDFKENPELMDESMELPPEVIPPAETLSPYKMNPAGQHMFIIVAESREIRLNPFKVKLSDYNLKFYSIEDLMINSLVLDNEHYLITIGNFNNSSKAMDYLDAIVQSEYVYADLKPGTFYNFVISTENYPVFFKEKDIGGYSKFFDKYYVK
ncbi:MAG: hypothetical protein MUC31_05670 [Bacteroidales bacterium]|nr:hypothetical protein [Bacteroidales bacterium]